MQNGVGKIYEVDLDGTLCSNTNGAYEHAVPFKDRIEKINQLYNNGNIININTARGATTGIDWYDLTVQQLQDWGVKYHSLTVGKKPHYDFIIDDKAINPKEDNWECIK